MSQLKTEEFINKAKAIHGDVYDYSKAKYTNPKTNVTITCKQHGEFEQRPDSHSRGAGCPICAGNQQSNTEEFIHKAGAKHGDAYDYSKVEYQNRNVKVTIICKQHGDFKQTPASHLKGNGCPKCGVVKRASQCRSNTEEFINRARAIHGDAYDYGKIEYKNARTNVILVCKHHGEFRQTPYHHLSGNGCSKCGRVKTSSQLQLNTEEFVNKAKEIHGDAYNYSKSEYKNSHANVIIICKQHGEFRQTPGNHLSGKGCPKCGLVKIGLQLRSNTEDFINKAKAKHGDAYDYSKSEYKNASTKVNIICKHHGEFKQAPNHHIRGQGCPKCAKEIFVSKPETDFLNFLNVPKENRFYPIGKYFVDGIVSNTIYEFLGDYYHGHPRLEKRLDHIKVQSVKLETKWRFDDIIKLTGFNIKYVWESDWNEYRKLGGHLKLRTYNGKLETN